MCRQLNIIKCIDKSVFLNLQEDFFVYSTFILTLI